MKYIIYIDILGFQAFAEDISEQKGIDVQDVRKHLVETIKSRVDSLKYKDKIIGKKYGHSDDWILLTDSLDNIFLIISSILNHNTGYTNFEKINREVAASCGEFDNNGALFGLDLIVSDDIIKFYKNNIIGAYRSWFKSQFNRSPTDTYLIIDEKLYKEFSKTEKTICSEVVLTNSKSPIYLSNIEKFKKRSKIIEFLEIISSNRLEYREIEALYVEPKEYNEIKNILNKNNIVLIIGDPEIGKTYTSIRLLLDCFDQGFVPTIAKRGDELIRYCENLYELEGKAIYIEDPWGKIKSTFFENDLREIGNLILDVKTYNTKIIISSRERIFDEFNSKKETSENILQLVQKIKIGFSYNLENMKEMLQRYIMVFEPKWSNDDDTKISVLNLVWKKLRTP